jgi:hypothetical protein
MQSLIAPEPLHVPYGCSKTIEDNRRTMAGGRKLGSGNSQTALVRSAVQTLMLVAANALLWFARINAIAYGARTAARTLRVQGRYAFGLVGRLASQARQENG